VNTDVAPQPGLAAGTAHADPRQGVLIERPGEGALAVAILATDLDAGQARGASTGFEEQTAIDDAAPATDPRLKRKVLDMAVFADRDNADRDHPAFGPFRLDAAVVAIGLAAEQAGFPHRKQRGQ
jgi:hypothetical protein